MQFQCCGLVNASDWSRYNVDAITENDGMPPMCPTCVVGIDEKCGTFPYVVTVLLSNDTRYFNTTTDVRDG